MRTLKVILMSLIALVSVDSEAAPERSYHCEGKLLGLDFRVEDLGRTYPELKYYEQHTYRITYRAYVRASGENLLKDVDKTQAYVKNDRITWDYAFATNPKGGSLDQPRQSIWVTSNDSTEITAMYYRAPYPRQEMGCRKL